MEQASVARSAAAPVPDRQSNHVRDSGERLIARLNSARDTLSELRDRLTGPRPPSPVGATDMATAIRVGGFVGDVGAGLERAHAIVNDIDELLQSIGSDI